MHNEDIELRKRLKEKLADALSAEALSKVYSSFDIVGDIAIIKAPNNNSRRPGGCGSNNGDTRMSKPCLLKQAHIKGDCASGVTLLAGENRTVTEYKESRLFLLVDVEKCYFSPRL